MPFLKINKGAYTEHTGMLGSIEFQDGKSVHSVALREAHRFASMIQVVDAETGEEISFASHAEKTRELSVGSMSGYVTAAEAPPVVAEQAEVPIVVETQSHDEQEAPVAFETNTATIEGETAVIELQTIEGHTNSTDEVEKKETSDDLWSFTAEEIEAIADKGGIASLREFADARGVRGVSIKGIIDSLVAKQQAVVKATGE